MMACTPERVVIVPVMVKLNKISSYLSSFEAETLSFNRDSLRLRDADEQPAGNGCNVETGTILSEQQNERTPTNPSYTSDKIKVYYSTDVEVPSKQPLNNFRCRLKTFGDVSWTLPTHTVSVYECVRRGWYLLQQDMLCCCSCSEMVCLQLPPSHSTSYQNAVFILRNRVLNKHKSNCCYLSYAEPVAMARPPSLLTTPHLYSLAVAAHQLASRTSTATGVCLPYLENGGKDVMDRLGVLPSLLQEVWGSVCDGWQLMAVLLALCGWKSTTAPDTIRCELCQRSIGLWQFLSYAEHQEREAAEAASVLSDMGRSTTEPTSCAEAGHDGNLDISQAMTELTEDLPQKAEDERSASKPCDAPLLAAYTEGGESDMNEGAEKGRALANISRLDGDDPANDREVVEEGAASSDPDEGRAPADISRLDGDDPAKDRDAVEEGAASSDPDKGRASADISRLDGDEPANDCDAVEEGAASSDPDKGRAPADISRLDGDEPANDREVVEGAASRDQSQGLVIDGSCESRAESITNEGEPNNITSTSGTEEGRENRNKRKRSECESDEEDQSKLVSEANDECSNALPFKRSKSYVGSQAPGISEPLPTTSGVSVEESTSSAITQVFSKPLFCPFTQHRYWCGWVTSQNEHLTATIEAVESTTNPSSGNTSNGCPDESLHALDTFSETHCDVAASSASDNLMGYAVFIRQLRIVLQLAQRRQWTASDKYAKTVDGLRSVRAHLTSWAK